VAKRRHEKRRPDKAATSEYRDDDGNVLTLRQSLSPGTVRSIAKASAKAGASAEDAWQRRTEMLFERLAVSWEIAGLPLDDQAMLLGRYRMASAEEKQWVRRTIATHIEEFIPELSDSL
jgi:hypothetical protein